jgi:hypothetical protein
MHTHAILIDFLYFLHIKINATGHAYQPLPPAYFTTVIGDVTFIQLPN